MSRDRARRDGTGAGEGSVARGLWLFVPGALAAALVGLPLSWDGSYFLVDLLDHGRPVILHGRAAMTVFQVPAAIGGHWISDTTVLGILFGIPYVLVPLVALWLSWRAVRATQPGLVVWAAVAIGLVTLPGQAFFVSESQMVGQLLWPLLLGVLTGHRWNRWGLGLWLVFLVLLHPMTAPALGVVALVAVVVARQRPARRQAAIAAAWLYGGTAVVRQVLTVAGVDAETPGLADYGHQWLWAVNGAPLVMICCVTVAAGLVSVVLLRRPATERTLLGVAFVALVVGALVMARWGADDHLWRSALDYRSFVVVFALPLVVVATVDALGSSTAGGARLRAAAVTVCGLAFSLTLVAQSLGWVGLVQYARDDLARQTEPCVVRHVAEKDGTALRHWANPSLALLVQGRSPEVVVVGEEAACRRLAATGELSLPRTGTLRNVFSHWFDLEAVRRALQASD